jgi:hypothetical protein
MDARHAHVDLNGRGVRSEALSRAQAMLRTCPDSACPQSLAHQRFCSSVLISAVQSSGEPSPNRERFAAVRVNASSEVQAKTLGAPGLLSPSSSSGDICAGVSWRRERNRHPTFSTRGEYAGLRDLSNDCAGLWDSGVWSAASPALGALPLGAPRQQQGFGVLLFIAEAFPNGTSEELAAFMDRG